MSLVPAPLRYLAARLRCQDSAAVAPYLRAGLGLEIRARKLAVHWRPHLDASRAAQDRWQAQGNRLAVLGAGRLLDFSHALGSRFQHLRIVDADPLCLPVWNIASAEPVIADVTGCLADWSRRLPRIATWEQTLDHIRSLRANTPRHGWLRDCDAILSLNLLSQIPVAWRDRVESHLVKHFGASYVKQRAEEWLTAIEPGARSLVDAHLAMLDASGAGHVLVITDLVFLEYQGGSACEYSRRRWDPPPVAWRDGVWIGDSSLDCQAWPALYGLEKPVLMQYREVWAQHWLWHICPLGLEPGPGSVHLVGAFCFER